MPDLYILNAANNQLSQDRLPVEQLLRCKKLSRLILSSNRFKGPAPIALIQLDEVVVLSLDDNAFDSLPRGVLPLPRLPQGVDDPAAPHAVDRVFWLSVNFGFSPLFEVSLRRNRLVGPVPFALLAQPCVQIDLGENQLTGICCLCLLWFVCFVWALCCALIDDVGTPGARFFLGARPTTHPRRRRPPPPPQSPFPPPLD